MTFVKHTFLGGDWDAPPHTGNQALSGGFEQSVFIDESAGIIIWWELMELSGQYNPAINNYDITYRIEAYPEIGTAVYYDATVQLSDATTGTVLGTAVAVSDLKLHSGTPEFVPHMRGNARAVFYSPVNHDWFLQTL